MSKLSRYFAMDSEGSTLAPESATESAAIVAGTPEAITASDATTEAIESGGIQAKRFGMGETIQRRSASDSIEYFQGLPAEYWTEIIDRRTTNYPTPSYANHFYVNTNVPLGILTLFYEGTVGEASLIRAANDWQRIGVNNEGVKIMPHPYGAEVGQNWWDDLMGQAGGITNRTPEAQAAHLINVVNLKIDQVAILGDAQVGKYGVKNNPLIGRTVATGRFTDTGMNPYDLVQYILRQRDRASIVNGEEEAMEQSIPNALLVPVTTLQYFDRPQYFVPPGSNGAPFLSTISDQLRAGGIEYIGASRWMAKASSTGGRAALLYRRDQGANAATQFYQPMTLERLPIYNNGHENILRIFSCAYDLWFSYPYQTLLIEQI